MINEKVIMKIPVVCIYSELLSDADFIIVIFNRQCFERSGHS